MHQEPASTPSSIPPARTVPGLAPRSTPISASPVKLSNRLSVEQAFQEIAVNCIAQISANEAGLIAGMRHDYSPEYLHQMRVGWRRLQCALQMFKDLIQPPADLRRELKWINESLGTARDWDVLCGKTLVLFSESQNRPLDQLRNQPPNHAVPDGLPATAVTALSEVILAATAKTHEHRKSAVAALTSLRYTELMLYLSFWVHAYGWRETSSANVKTRLRTIPKKISLKKYSLSKIKTLRHRLSRQARNIDTGKPRTLHKLRIAAKNTRYATEFFHSFCQTGKYLKRLTRFQEALGNSNDVIVARRLLKELAQAQPELRAVIKLTRTQLSAANRPDQKSIRHLCARLG